MEHINASQKRTRASGRKVRTGCATCKFRRVKCDEQKPECIRCINMGLKCGGYAHLISVQSPRSPASTSASSPGTPLEITNILQGLNIRDPLQQRAIEYYFRVVGPNIGGHFHKAFWTRCVYQLAWEEPMIRYAVIALSVEYERDFGQNEISDQRSRQQLQSLGLEAYNRSIHLLLESLSDPSAVSVPLMACLMLVCIDCIRQNINQALKHIDGGIKLLQIWRERCLDPVQRNLLFASSEYELIEEHMVPIFGILNLVTRPIGVPQIPPVKIKALSADPQRFSLRGGLFTTVNNAWLAQMSIVEDALVFIMATSYSARSRPNPTVIAEQQGILRKLDGWKHLLDESWVHDGFIGGDAAENEYRLMCAWNICIKLWVSTCLSAYETVWDQFADQFEELLRYVEALEEDDLAPSPQQGRKTFTFAPSIVPILQLVAWKCRYPSLRRKAIRLLRASQKREIIYDSSYAAALYERLMAIEEINLPTNGRSIPSKLPPETDRVLLIDVPPLPPTPNGCPVNFLSKPNGLKESWHVRCEYLSFIRVEMLSVGDQRNWREEMSPINRLQGFAPIAG